MKRILCISLILALIFSSSTVLAEENSGFYESDFVEQGEEIIIKFDKLEQTIIHEHFEISYDGNNYVFVALRDLKDVRIQLSKDFTEESIKSTEYEAEVNNELPEKSEVSSNQDIGDISQSKFIKGRYEYSDDVPGWYIRLGIGTIENASKYSTLFIEDYIEGETIMSNPEIRFYKSENGQYIKVNNVEYELNMLSTGFILAIDISTIQEVEMIDIIYPTDSLLGRNTAKYYLTHVEYDKVESANIIGSITEDTLTPTIPEERPDVPEETEQPPVIEEDDKPDIEEDEEPIVEEDNEPYIPEDITPGNPIIDEPIIEEDDEPIIEDTEDDIELEEEEEVIIEDTEDDEEIIEDDEEIVELLPKTGIAEVFNVVIALGFILILFGLKNLTNK